MGLGVNPSPPNSQLHFLVLQFLSLSQSLCAWRSNGVESVQNTNPIVKFTINGQELQPHQQPNQRTHRQMDAGTV